MKKCTGRVHVDVYGVCTLRQAVYKFSSALHTLNSLRRKVGSLGWHHVCCFLCLVFCFFFEMRSLGLSFKADALLAKERMCYVLIWDGRADDDREKRGKKARHT